MSMERNEFGLPVVDGRMEWSQAVTVVQDMVDASCLLDQKKLKYDPELLKKAWERILQG